MRTQGWSLRRARLLVGTKFLLVVGLVGFVVLAWLVSLVAGLDRAVHLGPVLAAAMAGIPALLWLGFFYLLDRHEPEPKQLVVGVFVLGALVAGPLAAFLQAQVAPQPPLYGGTAGASRLALFIYAVFVTGLAQEMCKYASVRYTVYLSREFNEPMDGIVYMMACGTGFAVWVNYQWLIDRGTTVQISVAAAKFVVTTLAHASFAGALGFVMGRAKFSRRSAPMRGLLLMLGLLGAAALNGIFVLVEKRVVGAEDFTQVTWRGVLWAAVYASLVFGLIMVMSQRVLATSPFRRGDA